MGSEIRSRSKNLVICLRTTCGALHGRLGLRVLGRYFEGDVDNVGYCRFGNCTGLEKERRLVGGSAFRLCWVQWVQPKESG
jgi:hypothetical protein